MHLGIRRPVRRRQQHLVARVAEHLERVVDGVLAAVGHEHLLGRAVEARIPLGLVRDRRAQLGQPGVGRVVVVPGLRHGRDGGLDDGAGRREVGLAGAEADHVLARGLQRLGLGVDGERRRLADGGDASGDTSHGPILGTAGAPPGPDNDPEPGRCGRRRLAWSAMRRR